MPSEVVLRAQRSATRMLIREEGRDVALIRQPAMVSDDEGGVVRAPEGEGVTLPAVRRFFGALMREGELVINDNGKQYVTEHVLIGTADDDIRKDDQFIVDGLRYYVRYVNPDQTYQTKAFVSRHASP